MRTRFSILVVIAAFFLITPLLRAAEVHWPATLGSYTDSGRVYRSADPPESGDPVLREAGFTSVLSRGYARGDRQANLTLTLYTFHDSSGAFEALSSVRFGEGKEAGPTYHTIYKSNLILNITGDSQVDPDTLSAATKWLQSISDGVAAPPIADYLPSRDQSMARYTLGPVGFRFYANQMAGPEAEPLARSAGFNSHAEAMFAKYAHGKDSATLLLIEYPTPQLAELHLRHLQRALADAKLRDSSIERKGSLLSIVLAPTSAEYAEKLRSSVNYETQVTWNEPSSTATDPPIISTLVKIIIATGVFMGVTLVLGIAFGGVRVITKRLFPGKVFDRKENIEVLQLGLGSKPIDPSDMY
jgi:hypothetical protein